MLKIVFLEKLLSEVELISIAGNEPKSKKGVQDIDIGVIKNETVKKFYCYITVLKGERDDVEENSIDIEPQDGEIIDEDTKQALAENDLLVKKLQRKIHILEFLLAIMLDEEFGVQTRCSFSEIKEGWVVVKPICKKCKGKRSCPIASEMPVERGNRSVGITKFMSSKKKYKISLDRSSN